MSKSSEFLGLKLGMLSVVIVIENNFENKTQVLIHSI